MAWLKKGHPRKKGIPYCLPETLWGVWLDLMRICLVGVTGNEHLQSSCIWGQSWYNCFCTEKWREKKWKIPNSISLGCIMVLCGQEDQSFSGQGVAMKELGFWRGKSRMELGWDCAQSKLSHTTLWFLEVSQFNLLTFGFHFQKRIHWMMQSCYIRFINILQWRSKEQAKYLRHMRFMTSD